MKTMQVFIAILFLAAAGCKDENKNIIDASGNIESTDVIVSSKVTGQVESIIFDEGKRVKSGDTVMIIDHEDLELKLAQAEALVDAAKAKLNLLKNGARKEDIQLAENSLDQSEINLETSKKDFQRMKELYDSKTITKKQFEDAKAKYQLSQSQFNSAKQNLMKIKKFARPEEVKQAEANLKSQQALANVLKKSISDSYIISPISGIITQKFVEKGETVSMLSSLFKVSELETVKLIIYVSETDLGKIKLGQNAEVVSDTYPDKKYKGSIIYISPEAEFTPKNIQTKDERTKLVFKVKIKIDNQDFELKSGMPADASILLN